MSKNEIIERLITKLNFQYSEMLPCSICLALAALKHELDLWDNPGVNQIEQAIQKHFKFVRVVYDIRGNKSPWLVNHTALGYLWHPSDLEGRLDFLNNLKTKDHAVQKRK